MAGALQQGALVRRWPPRPERSGGWTAALAWWPREREGPRRVTPAVGAPEGTMVVPQRQLARPRMHEYWVLFTTVVGT
jgi:hypothetical protein